MRPRERQLFLGSQQRNVANRKGKGGTLARGVGENTTAAKVTVYG